MLCAGARGSCMPLAVGAAIDVSVRFFTMPNDSTAAMRAKRCEVMDGAFKTVEHMSASGHDHFKGLRIVVSAGFASFFHMKDRPAKSVPTACNERALSSPESCYHQYHAAKKGLQKVIKALASGGKAGVIRHTQGPARAC